MAITNQERVGEALDLLRTEFAPFVAREQPASMKPRSSERGMQRRTSGAKRDRIASMKPRSSERGMYATSRGRHAMSKLQ